jgi:hypothetical protein
MLGEHLHVACPFAKWRHQDRFESQPVIENQGGADLSRARKQAEQMVVTAQAENKSKLLAAEAEGRSRALVGEGQAKRVSLEGQAEADVLARKVASYGDPRIYALSLVARHLSRSQQPLVPERVFLTGGGSDGDGIALQGLLGTLMSLLVAERTGFPIEPPVDPAEEMAEAGPVSEGRT